MTQSFAKPARTIDQQIAHLRGKGMAIEDEARARYWLSHVSYYRLSAYWPYFEHPKDQSGPRFRDGTSFDTVTALYDFDRVLRRLVMRGTEHVEVALRGNWATNWPFWVMATAISMQASTPTARSSTPTWRRLRARLAGPARPTSSIIAKTITHRPCHLSGWLPK